MRIKAAIAFIFLMFVIYFLLDFEKDQKIDRFLNEQTELFTKLYDSHYANYKLTSKMIYDSLVDQEEIFHIYEELETADSIEKNRLRKQLYEFLKTKYQKFQYTKLKQLHFHLKNNESFLRMHKPSKFGDNLTTIREGIAYVNRTQKPTDGFEMGRVYSGLRFVYPLINENNKHLGSVEVSFDISVFGEEFMDRFNVLSNFHLNGTILERKAWKESIRDHYLKSPLDGFYLEKRNTKILKKFSKKYNVTMQVADKTTVNKALESIKSKKVISLYDKKVDSVITFLPVLNQTTNEVVAFFTIRNYEKYITSKTNNFYFIFFMMTLLIAIIFIMLLKEFKRKEVLNKELEEKVKEETKEINRQKNFFDTLIQSSPIPFFYKDINGNYANVNQVWCDFTGFSKEEILGKSVYDVAPKEIADIYKAQDQKVFDLEENPQIYESKVVNKNTKKVYEVMFYKSAFINDKGDVEGIIGSLIDLTEIKKLQEEAIKQEKLLFEQAKLASMGEMIGNIAHQWRQPLSVISTSATGMLALQSLSNLTQENIEKSCNSINDNAQYLSKTIDDFRNFLKDNKVKKEFSIKENVEQFLSLISGSVKSANINIHLFIEEDMIVNGYNNELIQCYMNIYSNAKDAFMLNKISDKHIFIDVLTNDEGLVVIIKDNAGGIPQDIQSKIFEPYFTTKHQSIGTGLGLHMTYNLIVNSMNGTINVSNEVYEYKNSSYTGAKFEIFLPLESKES